MRTNFCVSGRYDRQRTLAIRIAAIILASDSAITIAWFRPSEESTRPLEIIAWCIPGNASCKNMHSTFLYSGRPEYFRQSVFAEKHWLGENVPIWGSQNTWGNKKRITYSGSYSGPSAKIMHAKISARMVLFRKRELTEFCGRLGEFCEKTRWVRFFTQIIGWEELTKLSAQNSVRAKKLTELGIWNRALWNRILTRFQISGFQDPAPTCLNPSFDLGNENSAQSFSDRIFWKPLRVVDVRAFGSWMSRRNACFFPGFWPPWPKSWAGISARMTPGCPRDVRPKNFLFGLIFRSWLLAALQWTLNAGGNNEVWSPYLQHAPKKTGRFPPQTPEKLPKSSADKM